MEVQRIWDAMHTFNGEHAEASYGKFKYADSLTEKIRENAIHKIAPDTAADEVIGVYDTSIGGSGKSGLIFTAGQVCSRKLKNGFIALDGMRFAVQIEGMPDRIGFLYEDGSLRDTAIAENSELRRLKSFFERLCGNAAQTAAPIKEWEELHRRKGRALRRKIEEAAVKRMNPGNLYLADSLDNAFPERICQKFQGQIRTEDVIFYNGTPGGFGGFAVTEYGLYSAEIMAKEKAPLSFDGLIRFCVSPQYPDKWLAVYENGYVREIMMSVMEDKEVLADFLNEISNRMQQLRLDCGSAAEQHKSLSSVEGWEQFLEIQRKQIPDAANNSVFISSTFRDMHYERDKIHDFVLPKLNQAGEAYGQQVSVCDLRWGVNTGKMSEEESTRKVLSVCLDEIERCRPYMVIILGDRYGWIPDEEAIQEAVAGRTELLLDELEKSVTELEIEFGALSGSRQAERIFFYFRTFRGSPSAVYLSEDNRHAKKLARLKERIRKLAGKDVRSYELVWQGENAEPLGLDAFAAMVLEDLEKQMQEDWRQICSKTPEQADLQLHWELAERKAGICSARDSFIQSCMELLEDEKELLAVTGSAGSGKSTVMGCLAVVERLRGRKVLPIFCGYTKKSQTGLDIVKKITLFLGECLGETVADGEQPASWWLERMEMLAARCQEKSVSVLIVLDAIDQLTPDEIAEKRQFIPEQLSSCVQLVFSVPEGDKLPYRAEELVLPLIREEERPALIGGNLRLYRRELEDCVIEAIARKEGAAQPLYVSLLTQRLLMMNKRDFDDITERGDGLRAISDHQIQLVQNSPETVSGLCMSLVEAAAQRIGHDFVTKAVECISLSRYGLRDRDLEGILGNMGIAWNGLDFSLFFHSMRSLFQMRADGRYDMSHSSIRKGIAETVAEKESLHRQIAEWLESLPVSDTVRRQELVYHGLQGGSLRFLRLCLRQYPEDSAVLKEAAVLFKAYCRENKQAVKELIEQAETEADFVTLHFIAYEFWFAETDRLLLEECLTAGEKAVGQIKNRAETLEEKRLHGVFWSRLGSFYQSEGQLQQALYCNRQALEKSLELAGQQDDPLLWGDVSIDYRKNAELLLKQKDADSLREAEHDCREALKAAEKSGKIWETAFVHKAYARYYQEMNQLTQAMEQEELRVSCLEEAVWEQPLEKHKRWLANACDDLGFLYWNQGNDPAALAGAKKLFLRAEELWKQLAAEEESPGTLNSLAYAQAILGDMLFEEAEQKTEQEQQEKLKAALEWYESSIRLFTTVQKDKNRTAGKERLRDVYRSAAEACIKLGRAEDRAACQDYARRSVKLSEELVLKTPEVNTYRSLKFSLLTVMKADEGNYDSYADRCLEVCEWLLKQGDQSQKTAIRSLKAGKKLNRVRQKV